MSAQQHRVSASSTNSTVALAESLKALLANSLHAAQELTGVHFVDQTFLQQYGPGEFLRRMLSTKSYISTTSSNAQNNQHFHENPDLRSFEKLGEGQTGTVFGLTGTELALKVAKKDRQDQLWNDHVIHRTVQDAFERAGVHLSQNIAIPRYVQFVNRQHELFWQENLPRFPTDFEIPVRYAFATTRIFTLPLPIRDSIVEAFAPKEVKSNKDQFLANPANKHCLVRLYLGRRQQRQLTHQFRLRNFDLTVGEMEWLRCDTHKYAKTMARALAILHWVAHVDANDVEFVLGSAPVMANIPSIEELELLTKDNIGSITPNLDFRHRSVGIWLLDFDQCQKFQKNAAGMELLKQGFWMNDPYYPRPSSTNQKDVALWTAFKEAYLVASTFLEDSTMPSGFIAAIEAEGSRRLQGGSMFQ